MGKYKYIQKVHKILKVINKNILKAFGFNFKKDFIKTKSLKVSLNLMSIENYLQKQKLCLELMSFIILKDLLIFPLCFIFIYFHKCHY